MLDADQIQPNNFTQAHNMIFGSFNALGWDVPGFGHKAFHYMGQILSGGSALNTKSKQANVARLIA